MPPSVPIDAHPSLLMRILLMRTLFDTGGRTAAVFQCTMNDCSRSIGGPRGPNLVLASTCPDHFNFFGANFEWHSTCNLHRDGATPAVYDLAIERLLTPGLILELQFVLVSLGKTLLLMFHRAKQSTRYGGPAWQETCKQNPKKGCSALLWLDRRRMPGSYKRTNINKCFWKC